MLTLEKTAIEIPQHLLDAAKRPETIDMTLTAHQRTRAAVERATAVVEIGRFLSNKGEIVPVKHKTGVDLTNPAIAYLDRHYQGWRGYEVQYVDGTKG